MYSALAARGFASKVMNGPGVGCTAGVGFAARALPRRRFCFMRLILSVSHSARILDAFPERIFSLSLSEIGKLSMLCFI